MLHQFTCNSFRSFFVAATAVMMGTSMSQTGSLPSGTPFDSIKPTEWTSNLAPSIGAKAAPIQVVFFFDYQCPSCRTADPVVRQAVSKRSDVALIYRDFPLAMHPLAMPAAIVAENARAHGTFDQAHRSLMAGTSVSAVTIKNAALKAGVSVSETPLTAKRIKSDRDLEQTAKLNYVPSFVVIENGKSTLMNKQQLLEFLK